ncbi:high mobility group box domain-containing protein [Artemisia annua]|uniref:High mobility group box domain-containing protein n=1 Tax=Artemisia annua TaxID=35608 RepID=A0A2U1Q6J9_ARTAN|nr:high mobility group box domain-containing protein [Artemisia annua]
MDAYFNPVFKNKHHLLGKVTYWLMKIQVPMMTNIRFERLACHQTRSYRLGLMYMSPMSHLLLTDHMLHLYWWLQIMTPLSNRFPTVGVSIGDTQMAGRSVMLDFAAGLIRHEVNVEPDGTEWANDIVHEIGGNKSFAPANGASVSGSRKRKQPEVTGYLAIALNRYASLLTVKKTAAKGKAAKDPNKPKRPACAFFVFM